MQRKISWFLLVGSALFALSSCSSNTSENGSDDSFASAMNSYSRQLVARTNSSITNPTVPEQTTDMPSFVVKYTVVNRALDTKSDGDKNIVSYAINTGITTAWSRAFCTDELKEIMGRYDVAMVTGQLVSKSGENESMSVCMK
jgi:hypothetical protein